MLVGGDSAAWVQAVGAVLAIVAGFATAAQQTKAQQELIEADRKSLVQAAHLLAFEALETACERLEAALNPPQRLSLRGDRTTEMILAMREFDTARLPARILPSFIRLRSHVYAINQRITFIYNSEENGGRKRGDRKQRLRSCVRGLSKSVEIFRQLQSVVNEFDDKSEDLLAGSNLAAYEKRMSVSITGSDKDDED